VRMVLTDHFSEFHASALSAKKGTLGPVYSAIFKAREFRQQVYNEFGNDGFFPSSESPGYNFIWLPDGTCFSRLDGYFDQFQEQLESYGAKIEKRPSRLSSKGILQDLLI
jgi:hypothetical protein